MARRDKLGAERDNGSSARRGVIRIGVVAVEYGLSAAVEGLVDVFAVATHWWRVHAGERARRFETSVLGASHSLASFTGRPVAIDATLDAWEGGEAIICSAPAGDPARILESSGSVVGWLREQGERKGGTIASVCTGAFFLAEAGLLTGLRATTNPLYARAFERRYPDVRLALSNVLVDEGSRITAGTASAAWNLAFHLVERHAGVEVATLTAKSLGLDKNRSSQDPYLIPSQAVDGVDELTARVGRWVEAHHADPLLSLTTIAAAHGVGTRTLQRRFVAATGDGPMDCVRRVRLEAAKRLLETTRESIDRITWKVGYRDARSFARLFCAYVALTPSAYREKFGMTQFMSARRRGASR